MMRLISKLRKSDNLLSLAGNASFAMFNAITFLILARNLSKEMFGGWIIYVTTVSLLSMLRLGLTGTGAIRSIAISTENDKASYIGATYQLGIYTFAIIAIIFYPAWYILKLFFAESYYYPVLLFYPLFAFTNLPYNQARIITQANMKFESLLLLKLVHGISMLALMTTYTILKDPKLEILIILHILSNFLPGVIAIARGWDGLKFFKQAKKAHIRELLQFGKYSTLISVGSSLLRSADTFILSMSAIMGPQAIAIYAIPMKFVEAVEIPLRSFSATAYPRLSHALKEGMNQFNGVLHSYNLATTMLITPIIITILIFSEPLLIFVGGNQYLDSIALQKNILYIIMAYILILPADRYTGVALFALNKPVLNFYKTMIMLVSNIIFDLIAVFVFKSLIFVALGTLIFTLFGVYWGWLFIRRESGAQLKTMFTQIRPIFNEAISIIKRK